MKIPQPGEIWVMYNYPSNCDPVRAKIVSCYDDIVVYQLLSSSGVFLPQKSNPLGWFLRSYEFECASSVL